MMGGSIYSRSEPFATALLIDNGLIAWVGDDAGAAVHVDIADRVVHLEGAFVAPGFVDSHVHATSTGLRLLGLDLSDARCSNDVLDAIASHAKEVRGGLIYGHGWDDTRWPDPTLPTRAEIDRASWGSEVYLSRIDVHSALVSSALIARAPHARDLPGFTSAGLVTRDAHHELREAALSRVSSSNRRSAQRATLDAAAAAGIVSIHEMGGPTIGGADDLRGLLTLASEHPGPSVYGYWGELATDGGIDAARDIGAFAIGGDLFVDGSLGSHTAALLDPYSDAPDSRGSQYLDDDQIAQHLITATRANIQAGFHVIGDAACASVARAVHRTCEELGREPVRRLGHRLEHAEMVSSEDLATLVEAGIAFSMQPLFESYWGGTDGMYEQRLGQARAASMNRLASIVGHGGHLTINSDSPVTPMAPWSIIRAATSHSNPHESITARAAFTAHTRGAWRCVGEHRAGSIEVGAPAHLAAWRVNDLEVRVPDERVQGWSTDPRSATPGLPTLDGPDPECLTTWVNGNVVFGGDFVEAQRG